MLEHAGRNPERNARPVIWANGRATDKTVPIETLPNVQAPAAEEQAGNKKRFPKGTFIFLVPENNFRLRNKKVPPFGANADTPR